jgi:hypothetical protein
MMQKLYHTNERMCHTAKKTGSFRAARKSGSTPYIRISPGSGKIPVKRGVPRQLRTAGAIIMKDYCEVISRPSVLNNHSSLVEKEYSKII